jgi:double-stranded uracil-DNA glycosylase
VDTPAPPLQPVPDVLHPDLRLLLVGINPGRRSSQMGAHFAGPGNRFWSALHAAGITPRLLLPQEQHLLTALGVGVTNLAGRPTARADQVSAAELRAGAARLEELVAEIAPRVVAVLGVTAYRVAFRRPGARIGEQPGGLSGARLWLLPNPSGLNAHARPADHAAGLRAAADAAGLAHRR